MSTFTGSTLAAAVARNATTASSFAGQTWEIFNATPIQVTQFVTDLFAAGNYTLTIDGVTFATVNGVGAAATGVTFTPGAPVTLAAGAHTLAMTNASGSVRWYDRNTIASGAMTGTGADYVGWGIWQEPAASATTAPGEISFKVADGTLLSQVAPNSLSGGTFAAQTWTVTFDTTVSFVGLLKRLRANDTTGYVLKIDGTSYATVTKNTPSNTADSVEMAFVPASPVTLTAGAHTFKIEPSAAKTFSFRSGTSTTPSGDAHTTAWSVWSESTSNQVDARLFYRLPDVVAGGQVTVTSTAQAGVVITGQTVVGSIATVTASVLAGALLVGAIVPGGQAVETSTAQAGVVATGTIIPGGTALETDSAVVGTVFGAGLVVGGQATETAIGLGGVVGQLVTGGQAGDTSTAVTGTVLYTVVGGQTGETDTVLAGTTGETVIVGGAATETDTALAGSLFLPYALTDTSNGDDGIFLGDGYAEVFFDPGVTPIPAHLALSNHYTIARVIDTPPVWTGTRYDLAAARTAGITGAIDRVLIDDVDWTFFRGAAIAVEGVKLIDPLLYGNARITIPAINPQFPDAELGDLVALFQFARVRVQRVVAGVVIATDHKGFVSRVDTSGTSLALEVGGQAAGALSQMYVPQSVYRRKQDVEHICVDLLRDARVRAKEHDGVSGIGLIKRSGADGLSIFNEYVAIWSGAAGQSVTFTPNADGVYRKTQKAGDEDPVDATAYIDNSLVTQSLAQDFMEQYTRVYAQGFTASGELVANIKTPGLTQGSTPAFPNGDDSPMTGGDTDADTDTGAGVTAVQQQLAIHDWLDIDDVTPGDFDLVTAFAVTNLQRWAGLNVTGEVGPNTWEALFDLPSIGYSLDEAREYPTAQDPRTFKWFRTANGSKIRENPDYDPHFIPNDLFIGTGGPFRKGEIEAFAESKMVPEGGIWNGTLTFRSGLIIGDHSPGDPLTTADVMDRRDLLPNMRVRLPYFAGGIVVYLAGVDHGPDETTCLASTSPMTTMESWQAIERRREAQSNPGRSWSGHTRASQVRNDLGVSWDTSSGWIGNKVALAAGWNEIKVPAGQEGIVKEVRIQLEDAAEFACLLTQRPVSTDALDSNPHTGTPLTDPRPSDRPWWEKEAVVAWLKARGYLNAWGTEAQPCGYDPSLKTDELGPTAQAITGLFVEEAGLNYGTDVEPVLYLYVWVGSDNALLPGRILQNLRTTDF